MAAKYKFYDGSQWVELLKSSDISSWAKASTKPSYTLDEVPDGSTRKLADYVTLATDQTINSNKTFKKYIYMNKDDTWSGDYGSGSTGHGIRIVSPNMVSNNRLVFLDGGYALNQNNSAHFDFGFVANGSTDNYINFGFYANDNRLKLYANGILENNGDIKGTTLYENGTALSNKYLGKSATAADSSKLGGVAASSYVLSSSLGTAAACNTGTSSGNVPVLDSNGKLSTGVLPALAITDTFTAASQSAMTSLTAQVGDICIRTDENKTYVLSAEPASTASNWKQLLTPTDANSYHSTGSWSGLTYTATANGGAPALAFTIPTGTTASTVCVGNDSRLSDARPASDVYAWAKASTKPSYNFSEIGAGSITMGDGLNTFYYRTGASLHAGFYYQTSGDESVVFMNQYNAAGWMFVNGVDVNTRPNWQDLTPTLQIKSGGVAIGKLIGQGVTPSYKLDVNGTLNATTVTVNTHATMQYNSTEDCLEFVFA